MKAGIQVPRMAPTRRKWRPWLAAGLFAWSQCAATVPPQTFVDERFEDFSAGTLGASGHNIYVGRTGGLQAIRRFDLDQNGHVDLVFNRTHDWDQGVPASIVDVSGTLKLASRDLNVLGTARVVKADFNGDRHDDLAFMPTKSNLQSGRNSLTIFWGGPDGWSNARMSRMLPVNFVTAMAAGDFDGDGYADLAALNASAWMPGQPAKGPVLRIYFGGPDGFLVTRHVDTPAEGATDIASGSANGAKRQPIQILTADGRLARLMLGPGREVLHRAEARLPRADSASHDRCLRLIALPAGAPERLIVGTSGPYLYNVVVDPGEEFQVQVTSYQVGPASHISFGFLDDDRHVDLSLSYVQQDRAYGGEPMGAAAVPSTPVRVLWGTANGFDAANVLSLDIPNAIASAVGDVNGDDKGDLAIAVHQSARTMAAESPILFGDGSRKLSAKGVSVQTSGAADVIVVKGDRPRPALIYANSLRGTRNERVPITTFWGTGQGFSRRQFWDLPFQSAYKAAAADFNQDGNTDFLVVNSGHGAVADQPGVAEIGVHLLWGGVTGESGGPGPNRFQWSRRLVLKEHLLISSNVADLNRDGFLDIVVGGFDPWPNPSADLVIYYGSEQGFAAGRKAIPVGGRSMGCLIGDFDRDGHLDIGVAALNVNKVVIFRGGADGFFPDRKWELSFPAPVELETADLDQDGWLDLIVGSYYDPTVAVHDTGLAIFWGGARGFHETRSQWLPAVSPIGVAVGDLDGDGALDIVAPSYHANYTRESIPSYIFWGHREGFHPQRRTPLMADSAHDAMIADFNSDGRLDIAFSAHSRDLGHADVDSPVYFNDGARFDYPATTRLPTPGSHFMWVQDLGNIYTRKYREDFISRVFAGSSGGTKVRVAVDAEIPRGAGIEVEIRSAPAAEDLTAASWRAITGGAATVHQTHQFFQYRLTLVSPNGDAYPRVRRVAVSVR